MKCIKCEQNCKYLVKLLTEVTPGIVEEATMCMNCLMYATPITATYTASVGECVRIHYPNGEFVDCESNAGNAGLRQSLGLPTIEGPDMPMHSLDKAAKLTAESTSSFATDEMLDAEADKFRKVMQAAMSNEIKTQAKKITDERKNECTCKSLLHGHEPGCAAKGDA